MPQVLSNIEFKNTIDGMTLAQLAVFWKSHREGKVDLTLGQKIAFATRCTYLKLGLRPLPIIVQSRHVEVVAA